MVGLWYVHRAFSTSSTCLTFNYTRTASGLEVVETKELRALDAVGLDHKYSSVGTLRDNGLPGAYQASFSTSEHETTTFPSMLSILLCPFQIF